MSDMRGQGREQTLSFPCSSPSTPCPAGSLAQSQPPYTQGVSRHRRSRDAQRPAPGSLWASTSWTDRPRLSQTCPTLGLPLGTIGLNFTPSGPTY